MNITFVELPEYLIEDVEGKISLWTEGFKTSIDFEDFENLDFETKRDLLTHTQDFIVITNVDEETFEQYVGTIPVVGTNERFVIPADCILNEHIDELLSHSNFEIV